MKSSAETLQSSHFWSSLKRMYAGAPSIAMCRVPELEFAALLPLDGKTLDHCCGDGFFASLAWPQGRFTAGCDIDGRSVEQCRKRGRHESVEECDAAKGLPYADATFDLVFNNSALEHIPDVDAALREIARVTKPGGTFAFNVLNHRYFEWWPGDDASKQGYREWQPFFHAFTREEWTERLRSAGFSVESVRGYFLRDSARELALLDCEFSGLALRQRASALVESFRRMGRLKKWLWWRRLGGFSWTADDDAGAGYFITAKRL
jgi:SAM-dependent methyltransferase